MHSVGHVSSPLYLITTVFNPRRFHSRIKLYNAFARWVKDSGVRLLTVEVAFGERTHVVTANDDPWHLQLFTRQEMWHKERAMNLGLQRLSQLVPGWKYVAWADSDIQIARPDWADETVHMLQHYAVVQMFGQANLLGPDHHILHAPRSIARNFEDYGSVDWYTHPGVKETNPYVRAGHPGLAWAFRRDELYAVGGWLDVCVNGSGDLHMVGCYAGQWQLAGADTAPPGYRDAIRQYGALCDRSVRRNMSYLPGVCSHFWHGRMNDRGYEDRLALIKKYQFNPKTDLTVDLLSGLYKWNLSDPRVHALATAVRRSLSKRNEDVNEA